MGGRRAHKPLRTKQGCKEQHFFTAESRVLVGSLEAPASGKAMFGARRPRRHKLSQADNAKSTVSSSVTERDYK